MNVQDQITAYIAKQTEPKRADMQELHRRALRATPKGPLSFFDGRDETGKTVSNPTIGYGTHTMRYADGSSKDIFRVGVSANTTGISVYVLGLDDKAYLKKTFGKTLGKASITGYCVRFKSLKDVDVDVLDEVIRFGLSERKPAAPKPARKASREKPGAAARKKTAKRTATARKK